MLELYGSGQSRSFRVLWALEEVQANYQYIAVNFGSTEVNGTQSAAYQNLNFQGKVPTFVDRETECVITESAAILNYLAGKFPETKLMPQHDLKQQARYDQICFFILTELEQPLWTQGKHKFALPKPQRVPEVIKTAHWEFQKAQDALQALFKGNGYVVGSDFTMADILLAHTLSWAERFKFEVSAHFLAYRDRMVQRTACQRAFEKINIKP